MKKKRLVLIVVLVWSAICLGLYYFLVFRDQPLRITFDSSRSGLRLQADTPGIVIGSGYATVVDSAHWKLHILGGGMYERPTESAGYRIWADSLHRTVKKRKKKTSHPLLMSGAPIEHAELSEGRLDSLFKFDPKLTHCCFLWSCDPATKIYCCTDGVVMNWDTCRVTIKGDTVKAIRFIARGFDSLWRLSYVLQHRLDSLVAQKKGGKP